MVKAEKVKYDYMMYTGEDEEPVLTHALKGVDFDVKKGEFIAVLGHNGSGKSTLAKHLNALLVPTEGTVHIGGIDTREEKRVWDIRQMAGMVFQNPDNQIVASVVEEDVAFGPENIGVPTDEIWERVDDALNTTGMTAYRESSPNRLSGGQKQRVAIAGVMAMRPECIVLDEPTAMLDPVGRKEVLEALHLLNKDRGVTVILITHYMEEVANADRVFVMNDGEVVMTGTPKEIFSDVAKLNDIGLEVPQVTLLAYELKNKGVCLPDGIISEDEFVEEILKLWRGTPSVSYADSSSNGKP